MMSGLVCRTTAEPTMWPIEAKLSTGIVAALKRLFAQPYCVGCSAVLASSLSHAQVVRTLPLGSHI